MNWDTNSIPGAGNRANIYDGAVTVSGDVVADVF